MHNRETGNSHTMHGVRGVPLERVELLAHGIDERLHIGDSRRRSQCRHGLQCPVPGDFVLRSHHKHVHHLVPPLTRQSKN